MEQKEIRKDKRYLIFAYDAGCADGGYRDLYHDFNLAQAARDYANNIDNEIVEVYDTVERVLIYTRGYKENIDIRTLNEK